MVGLEVHAQLLTRTKAFCACSAAFGGEPNTKVCPVCLGLPGALPVLNEQVVAMAVRAALALGGDVQRRSVFARKNYFYPDLPKGYQITQYDAPLSRGGAIELDLAGPEQAPRRARLVRLHIEEDAGKTLHDVGAESVVDCNRAGVPLVEIVGEPDLRSGREAAQYLRSLRDILIFIGVNDGNLEEGSFRCDANVSVRPAGDPRLGTRVELKNINSFRFVQKAVDHEVARQTALVQAGGAVVQETRGYDEKTGSTYSMRSKEEANDYRYFPEPDLPPLILDDAAVERERARLPELPRAKRARLVAALGLTPATAEVLTQHPVVAAFFEEAARLHGDPVRVANFVQSEVLRDVTTHGLAAQIPVTSKQVADLLGLVAKGALSGKQAKEVYAAARRHNATAEDRESLSVERLVNELGMAQVSDAAAIEEACRRVVQAHPRQAEQLRGGKTGLTGFFVGQVMKEMGGSANPRMVQEALKKVLEG